MQGRSIDVRCWNGYREGMIDCMHSDRSNAEEQTLRNALPSLASLRFVPAFLLVVPWSVVVLLRLSPLESFLLFSPPSWRAAIVHNGFQ